MDIMEKHATMDGGRVFLNKEETIQLDVPKRALREDTVITWSFKNAENTISPELIIEARSKDTGKVIKIFQKHVIITFKNIQCSPGYIGVAADGVAVPNQQVHPSEKDPSDHCIFHTFYKRNEKEVMIFTRHFSHFLVECEDHGNKKKPTLFAVIFRSRVVYTQGISSLDVLVVLDINNTNRTKRNKTEWMINDYEEYELVKTITLDTPTETEVVKPDATFRCSVSLEDTGNTSWFCINEMGKDKQLDHVIKCQKCRLIQLPNGTTELENLPEAAVLQFENKDASNVKTFRADFSFSIQPSGQEHPTVTTRRITIEIDDKFPIPVESENNQKSIMVVGEIDRTQTNPYSLQETGAAEPERSRLVTDGLSEMVNKMEMEEGASGSMISEVIALRKPIQKQELTDEDILLISQHITVRDDVRKLGLIGLHLKHKDTQKALEKHPDSSTDAAYDVLHEWKKSVKDPVEAFEILYYALTHKKVNLIEIANKLKNRSLGD